MRSRHISCLLWIVLLAPMLMDAESARYSELRSIVHRNAGYAHMTRGVNMYTLYALRSCVSERDIGTLSEMLGDKDDITRMAAAAVLVDLGGTGKQAVHTRIARVADMSERMMLQESLEDASKPDYRPILQYPLSDSERIRVRGCHSKDAQQKR